MQPAAPRKPRLLWRAVRTLVKFAVVLAILAVPTVGIGLPVAARTKWARAKAEKALAELTGGTVDIGRMSFSWRKGLTLAHVRMERPDASATVREIVIGRRRSVVREPAITLRDFRTASSFNGTPRFPKHEIVVRDGMIAFEDARLAALNVEATVKSGRIEIEKLTGVLNGGSVEASGVLSRERARLELTATGVEANLTMARALRHLVPVFEIVPGGELQGRLDARLALEGPPASMTGTGELAFSGRLSGARLMRALAVHEPGLGEAEFSQVLGRLQFADGRAVNLGTELRGASGAARLTGWVDRGLAMDIVVSFDRELGGRLCDGVRIAGTTREPQVLIRF